MLNEEAKVRETKQIQKIIIGTEKRNKQIDKILCDHLKVLQSKIIMKSPRTMLPHCCGDRLCFDPAASFLFKRCIIVCGQNTIPLCGKTLCCLFFYLLCTCNPRPQIFCIASSLHASSSLYAVVRYAPFVNSRAITRTLAKLCYSQLRCG